MHWNDEANDLLEELVKPIPPFVRPMAKKSIINKVEHLAQETGMEEVKILQEKNIDLTPYQSFL
jgi:hypothetical protein